VCACVCVCVCVCLQLILHNIPTAINTGLINSDPTSKLAFRNMSMAIVMSNDCNPDP
jgi:hypothetical protein